MRSVFMFQMVCTMYTVFEMRVHHGTTHRIEVLKSITFLNASLVICVGLYNIHCFHICFINVKEREL